jgi:hypothetical protein
MVLNYLDKYLPMELADLIYKKLHNSLMRDICDTINYKIVYTCLLNDNFEPYKISFLICENQNFYTDLEVFS